MTTDPKTEMAVSGHDGEELDFDGPVGDLVEDAIEYGYTLEFKALFGDELITVKVEREEITRH